MHSAKSQSELMSTLSTTGEELCFFFKGHSVGATTHGFQPVNPDHKQEWRYSIVMHQQVTTNHELKAGRTKLEVGSEKAQLWEEYRWILRPVKAVGQAPAKVPVGRTCPTPEEAAAPPMSQRSAWAHSRRF